MDVVDANGSLAVDAGLPVEPLYAAVLRGLEGHVQWLDEALTLVPVSRWRRAADRSDRAVLDHCVGATLDVGCGPGRMAEYLADRGHDVLALDRVSEAVTQAGRRGVPALLGDVFDPVPGEGAWDTVLLADGNIGIGGDPLALLVRVRDLLSRAGRVVVDLDPPGSGIRSGHARLHVGGRASRTFVWSTVAADAVAPVADAAGFAGVDVRRRGARWFAVLDGAGA